MNYYQQFFVALPTTIISETVVLFIIVKAYFKISRDDLSNQLLIFTGVLCSFATLPYLWFIFPYLIRSRKPFVITGEIFVTLVESVIIYYILKWTYKRSLIVSIICNASSIIIGLLFFR